MLVVCKNMYKVYENYECGVARIPQRGRTSSGRSVLLVELRLSENYQFAAAVKVGGTTCKLFHHIFRIIFRFYRQGEHCVTQRHNSAGQ